MCEILEIGVARSANLTMCKSEGRTRAQNLHVILRPNSNQESQKKTDFRLVRDVAKNNNGTRALSIS